MARFEKYPIPFNNLLKHPNGMVGKYLQRKGAQLTALAKEQVGVDTGALKKSIRYKLKTSYGTLAVEVTAHDDKALMHHQGTRRHYIRARKAKALRFKYNGKIVYRKIVNHPGTDPNKFLTDNLAKVIDT